jgi:intracellular septation protein
MNDTPETQPLPTIVRRRAQNPMLKLVLEMGPLVLFLVTNFKFGIMTATAVLMVGVVVSLVASWFLTRQLPVMPMVTAVAVLLFGALTLYFQDSIFIKMKPTIVNVIFGSALLGALFFKKLLLPIVLDSALHLTEEGWRKLSRNWALFFVAMAVANEVMRRSMTFDAWLAVKVWGVTIAP